MDTQTMNVEIGRRIAEIRKSAPEKQETTAQYLNMVRSNYTKKELGQSAFSPYELAKLAEHFGVDCHYLITGIKAVHYDIHEETGLSDKAIERLHRLAEAKNNPPRGEIRIKNISAGMLKALNALLESKSIEFMLCFLNEYIQALANIHHGDADILNGVREVCWDIRAMGSHDVAELESAGYRVLSPSKAVDYAYFQVSDSFSDILKNELVKGAVDDGEH